MAELLAFSSALLVTLAATKPLIAVLAKRQVIDVPNARSSHREVVPRGGGIAVVLGLVLALVVAQAPLALWVVMAAVLAAAAVGFADDVRGLSAFVRLALQLVLAVALVAWLVRDAPSSVWLMVIASGAAVLWLVGYVNVFNFMDGINGISAVTAAMAGLWYLLLGGSIEASVLTIGGAALAGGAIGFLPWNALRARVFLGDVGSYAIGLLIGALALTALLEGASPLAAAAPLLVYLADTAWTLLQRVRRGDTWHEAHREHVYQRLTDVGLSHLQVVGVVAMAILVVCLAVWSLSVWVALPVCAALLVAYLSSPRLVSAAGSRDIEADQP